MIVLQKTGLHLNQQKIAEDKLDEEVSNLMDKYDIGYCAVNFPKTKCETCGFEINKIN